MHQTKAQASKDWGTCERLQSEINMLQKETHSLLEELKVFKRKQQESQWRKKKRKSDSVKEHQGNQRTLDQLKVKEKSVNDEIEVSEVIEVSSETEDSEIASSLVNSNASENNKVAVSDSSTGEDFVRGPLLNRVI